MILGGLDLRRYPIPRGYLYSFVVDMGTTFWDLCVPPLLPIHREYGYLSSSTPDALPRLRDLVSLSRFSI